MGKKTDIDEFFDSQKAINDYMHYKAGNAYMHDARVLVSSKGKNKYNNILKVIPSIENNYSFVEIFGDAQFERDYYGKYINVYQKFTFIHGTLLIKGEDRWGNSIEIDITSA